MKLAQITNPALGEGLQAKTGAGFFQDALPAFITLAFVIGTVIFLFMLISGAISWMTSGGDKQTTESARSKVTNAIVGLVILFAVYAVIGVLEDFFDVDIVELDFGQLKIEQSQQIDTSRPPSKRY